MLFRIKPNLVEKSSSSSLNVDGNDNVKPLNKTSSSKEMSVTT